MIAAKPPADKVKVSNAEVTVWEKQDGEFRYVVAMAGEKSISEKEQTVSFTLTNRAAKAEVLFEGRSLPIERGSFADQFVEPYTVRVYRISSADG